MALAVHSRRISKPLSRGATGCQLRSIYQGALHADRDGCRRDAQPAPQLASRRVMIRASTRPPLRVRMGAIANGDGYVTTSIGGPRTRRAQPLHPRQGRSRPAPPPEMAGRRDTRGAALHRPGPCRILGLCETSGAASRGSRSLRLRPLPYRCMLSHEPRNMRRHLAYAAGAQCWIMATATRRCHPAPPPQARRRSLLPGDCLWCLPLAVSSAERSAARPPSPPRLRRRLCSAKATVQLRAAPRRTSTASDLVG